MGPTIVFVVSVAVAVAACSGDPGPRTATPASAAARVQPAGEDLEALREHCDAMTGRSEDCERDPVCAVGNPRKSCFGHVCTAGGPLTCETCIDHAQRHHAPAGTCER